MGYFSDNGFVKSAMFFVLLSRITKNTSSGNNNSGCGCISIIAIIVIGSFLWGTCVRTDYNNDAYTQEETVEIKSGNETPIINDLPIEDSSKSSDVFHRHINFQSAPRFSAQTLKEAYEEGYSHGFDDGEEDGMNYDEDASYDESNPYVGKMKKSYIDGYQAGYEYGKEEGIDVYN